jgi:hypothetical protein
MVTGNVVVLTTVVPFIRSTTSENVDAYEATGVPAKVKVFASADRVEYTRS